MKTFARVVRSTNVGFRVVVNVAAATAVFVMVVLSVQAQTLGEIIVAAKIREDSLQDTPLQHEVGSWVENGASFDAILATVPNRPPFVVDDPCILLNDCSVSNNGLLDCVPITTVRMHLTEALQDSRRRSSRTCLRTGG